MNLERKITFRLDGSRFDELDDLARREGFSVSGGRKLKKEL